MTEKQLKDLQELISKAINSIGIPPQGRELALVKTKLEEAEMWSNKVKTV